MLRLITFSLKITIFHNKNKLVRKVALFLHFCRSPYCLWLENKQPNSPVGFCTYSAVISAEVHVKAALTQTRIAERKGYVNSLFIYLPIFFLDNIPKPGKRKLQSGTWNHIGERCVPCYKACTSVPCTLSHAWFCNPVHCSFGKCWTELSALSKRGPTSLCNL